LTTTADDAARTKIERNHQAFAEAVERARVHLERGELAMAAVLAGVASNLATWMHPGLFASGQLERVAREIARAAAGGPHDAPRRRGTDVARVLHVFSRTLSVGGHTRMVWRWMGLDDRRSHSVVVTRQGRQDVPRELVAMAESTGGSVTVLDRAHGDVLARAGALHDLATQVDVVILHIDPEDIVPIVAFGDRSGLPPILYLNHADHLFWLGVGVADLVVNLRRSGHALSPARRGVTEDRNAFLPIALGERRRQVSREEAKRRLGIPPETVLLATVARAVKFEYESGTGDSYVDAVTPVVEELEQVRLIVVGPVQEGGFRRAHEATGGRITALGERLDNELLYQAVDLYLDSYPQMSPTSLLEAGSYGTPLLALCPQLDVAPILSGDAPGIDEGLLRARSVEEFRAHLKAFVLDAPGVSSSGRGPAPTSSGSTSVTVGECSSRPCTGQHWRQRRSRMSRRSGMRHTSPRPTRSSRWAARPMSMPTICSPSTCGCCPAALGSVRGSDCGAAASGRP